MAFCVSCGGNLDAGAKFCAQCGQTVAAPGAPGASAPATTPPVSAAPVAAGAPAKSRGGAAKIIFALLGTFAFFVLAAAGSCFYIGYRVRKRAQEFSRQYKPTPYEGHRVACRLPARVEVATAFQP